ncbi:MAG: hypothetical protein BRC53_09445 [Cyanobacteria bacterium SW_6_48_11]|nr:MAG: hypothetical protein BRC53_09445 [Cyanobacteria bacterium SW_6_48_11]
MFGSWARGEANSDSDLDLLVLTRSQNRSASFFRDSPSLLRSN